MMRTWCSQHENSPRMVFECWCTVINFYFSPEIRTTNKGSTTLHSVHQLKGKALNDSHKENFSVLL